MRLFWATEAGNGTKGTRNGITARIARPAEFDVDGRSNINPQAFAALVADVAFELDCFAPEAVHIDACGPLGWAVRAVCIKRGWDFTTSATAGDVGVLGLVSLRAFHSCSSRIVVEDDATEARLRAAGLRRLIRGRHVPESFAEIAVPACPFRVAAEVA